MRLAADFPELNKEMINKMFTMQDLSGMEDVREAEILKRAAEMGLRLEDLNTCKAALIKKLGSEERMLEHITELRGVLFAFKFLYRNFMKYAAQLEANPDNEKAKQRLQETEELYSAAVQKYKLPAIDFKTAMGLIGISPSPVGWYLAYALKHGSL